jgi:hypothetical protein
MIDKATGGLAVIRLLQKLQRSAPAAGGKVVVTMGNHEAEFLADPLNDKAAPFLVDLSDAHLDAQAVAEGRDELGAWLQGLPIGIVDRDWVFSHAGYPGGVRTLTEVAQEIETDVRAFQFDAPSLLNKDSILEAEQWWTKSGATPAQFVDAILQQLPARHLVFGHDPSALGKRGSVGQLLDGRLFPVDAGMSPAVNDSQGVLMLLERGTSGTTVSAAFPSGPPSVIFTE